VLNADIWMQDGFEHLQKKHFLEGSVMSHPNQLPPQRSPLLNVCQTRVAFALSRYQMPGCGYKKTVCAGDGTDSVPGVRRARGVTDLPSARSLRERVHRQHVAAKAHGQSNFGGLDVSVAASACLESPRHTDALLFAGVRRVLAAR
jgi:hypothetical protein